MTDGSTTNTLSEPEQRALEGLAANRNTPATVTWRATIILASHQSVDATRHVEAGFSIWRYQRADPLSV